MIAEENAILWGQNNTNSSTEQAPGAVGNAPNLSNPSTATTGGSIAGTTTAYVKQTCITGMGESLPSSTPASVTTGATATNTITITPVFPSNQPVVGFNFYWSSSSGGTYTLITSTNVSASLSDGQLPGGSLTWLTNGDAITVTSLPTTGTTAPSSDASASANAFNGIYPQMVGGTGATLTKAAGALSTTILNKHFKALWNSAYKADPDMMLVAATESIKINGLTLGNGTPYYVMVGDQPSATANFRVARYTNPVTGSEIPVRVHPTAPQGTILTLSSKLPGWYVPTDVPTVWAMDLPQDYVEIDYPPNQSNPFWQTEVRMYGALKVYLPGLQGAVYAINNT